jgi:uncharacterized membrane protein YphA (DoxX/SURF4 family)
MSKETGPALQSFAIKLPVMNSILWTAQVILAITFLYSGFCKAVYSQQQLIAKGQTGVAGRSPALIRFIGISEIVGAIGVVLPWYTGIAPVLTPLAAGCFAVLMLLAAPIHYKLKEPRNVATNITLLVIALFVAWARAHQL